MLDDIIWTIISLLLFFIGFYVLIYFIDPYQLMGFWNKFIEKERNSQNRKESLLEFGLVGFTPGNNSNLPLVKEADNLINENYEIISKEFNDIPDNEFVFMVDIDDVHANTFPGERGWTSKFIRFGNKYNSLGNKNTKLMTMVNITKILDPTKKKINMAYITRLEPGTLIRPHNGPSMAVWTYTYVLKSTINDNFAKFFIEGHVHDLIEKTSIVYDPTISHAIYNQTHETIVLIVIEFFRDFSFPLRFGNQVVSRMLSANFAVDNIYSNLKM